MRMREAIKQLLVGEILVEVLSIFITTDGNVAVISTAVSEVDNSRRAMRWDCMGAAGRTE